MSWRFIQVTPQPARGAFDPSLLSSDEWVAEEKYDGDRRIAQFCSDVVRFTGRRASVKDGKFVERSAQVPHLSAAVFKNGAGSLLGMRALHLGAKGVMQIVRPPRRLDGTVLDGEMIVPVSLESMRGGKSKHVTSIIGSLPEEALWKQVERGWLRYAAFDCLWHKGHDVRGLPLFERRALLVEAVAAWGNPFAFVAPQSGAGDKAELLQRIWRRSGEGVILKHVDHRYGQHLRWVKVKQVVHADVVVMGYKAARSSSQKVGGEVSAAKFSGQVGSIVFGQYVGRRLVAVGSTSGFDDELRAELTRNGRRYVGRVMEISANGREPTGAFRHPQFSRWRDDKRARECVQYEGET